MKKYIVLCIIMFCNVLMYSQSHIAKFHKLSSCKKWWVVFHVFKAKDALQISNEAYRVTDSIFKVAVIGDDRSGGNVDAFRHAFWMARLKQSIGEKAARSLGKVHEKENYQYFLDNKLEDGTLPDKASMDMDLHNNEVGLELVNKGEKVSKSEIVMRVINAINSKKALVIKKDIKKRFLTCSGVIIPKDSLSREWINKKCLIASNSNSN